MVRTILVGILKIGLSLGIMTYLVWDSTRTRGDATIFITLINQPKNWGLLAAAWLVLLTATMLTFLRWWYLVRALDVPCRLTDALRIAFWGILFNLAPLGVVGGDLVKAVMLGHEHREQRASVVASVLVDRALGLFILFLFTSVTILLTGFWRSQVDSIRLICDVVFAMTGAATLGVLAALMPDVTGGRGTRMLRCVPRVGPMIERLVSAMRLYRHKLPTLAACSLIAVGVQTLSVVGYYLIACGLPGNQPSLGNHFVIIPLSVAAGVVPLPLGPMEFVIEFLYTQVPHSVAIAKGQGLVVALVYRLISILNATLGVLCHSGGRCKVAEVMHKVEEEQPMGLCTSHIHR